MTKVVVRAPETVCKETRAGAMAEVLPVIAQDEVAGEVDAAQDGGREEVRAAAIA